MALLQETQSNLDSVNAILEDLNQQDSLSNDGQELPNNSNPEQGTLSDSIQVAQTTTPSPSYAVPRSRPWVEGVFDMGTGTLRITRYERGQPVDSVEIAPSRIPTSNALRPGAYSGDFTPDGVDLRNESEGSGIKNAGAVVAGEVYSIKTLANDPSNPLMQGYLQRYKEHGVSRPWFKLDAQDGIPHDDTVTAPNGVWRDGLRLHMGRTSIGCVTVHPDGNQQKWIKIEELIPEGDNNEIVGQLRVIDSQPGPGNATFPRAGAGLELE